MTIEEHIKAIDHELGEIMVNLDHIVCTCNEETEMYAAHSMLRIKKIDGLIDKIKEVI